MFGDGRNDGSSEPNIPEPPEGDTGDIALIFTAPPLVRTRKLLGSLPPGLGILRFVSLFTEVKDEANGREGIEAEGEKGPSNELDGPED